MEQQLLEQVTNQLNKLRDTQEQIESIEAQLIEKYQNRRTFLADWKSNCNHVLYAVQHLAVCTWVTESYHCCLCSKDFDKRLLREPPQCIGSYHINPYSSETNIDCYPIPTERQAEVDTKKSELAKMDAEIAFLEEKLRTLRKTATPIEKELENIMHSLMTHFHYPQTVYETPHRWECDDFNYDSFD